MVYIYSIDLAEDLNFCGIIVTSVTNKIRIHDLRKFNKIHYPMIQKLLIDDMFPKAWPEKIVTDYTNERSFTEYLETTLNPGFSQPGSEYYNKWRYVEPIISNQKTNLEMKQNARNMQESGLFLFPSGKHPIPEKQALMEELEDQMNHEAADPSRMGGLKFPKPQGRDNDLIRSLELNLMEAKNHLEGYGGNDYVPLLQSFGMYDNVPATKLEELEQVLSKQAKVNLNRYGTSRTVRIKLPGKDEFEN